MKTKYYFRLVLAIPITILFSVSANSQNKFPSKGSAGIGTTSPNASSLLEMKSTSKGLLIPRMTLDERNKIASPAGGLLIYQTNNTHGFYYYDGSVWQYLPASTSVNFIWKKNGSAVYYTGGNVGIGTNNPVHRLDVNGDINLASGKVLRIGGIRILKDNVSSGDNNVFVGDFSDTASSPGFRNTAVGSYSLDLNTGAYNTAVGSTSLRNNTTGTSNAAFGEKAMQGNITGSTNSAVGSGALQNNTTGSKNTAAGFQSLFSSNADFNTAVGYQSLNHNTSGHDNTGVGLQSLLLNTTGASNVSIGNNSMFANATGSFNTAIGTVALFSNSTGSNNTAIGGGADVTANNLTNATAIGYNAKVSQSNSLVLGGTGTDAVNVGIGITNPQYTLSVNGTIQTKEVRVETGWADFVFDKNYTLRPLNDVEKYVRENKHLPDMPAAVDVKQNGLAVGEMETKMMQKIEELTLYVIDLQKEIEALKSKKNESN